MNNGLLYLGCFFALLLAALFGVPYAIDWNGYRGVFEEEATKVLGRDVRVGGAVSVRLLPSPYVRFEKVRLADTTGQTGEPFIRADSFTMRLAVSPLLRGAFEATEIELAKPVLSLVPDNEGGGNWASLQLKPGELPFIPQNVTLHSVRLVDGMVAVHRAEGGISRIELINGELSAETLKGPYKFKGTGVSGGTARDIKFATFAPDQNGVVRFKAALHGKEGENSYLFDGQLEDFTSKPRISGDLTGKIVLPPPHAADGNASKEPPPVFDLKSNVKADARGATFEGIELALDGTGEPQIITGTATAQWAAQTQIDAKLSAKWLDLDLLAAPKDQQATIPGLKTLFVTVMDGLGGGGTSAGKTAVHLDVEQVKFGGDQAGSLLLDAERLDGMVALRQLKSGLPGGARFELWGEIRNAGQNKAPSFSGEGIVRGVNFERAQAFANRSGIDVDLKSQGPFWLAGRVAVDEDRFVISQAKGEIGGQSVSGEVDIARGERNRIAVRIEGEHIDSAVFFPKAAGQVDAVLRSAFGQAEGKGTAGASKDKPNDTSFRIVTGEFLHNGKVLKNVDATVAVEGSVLRVENAQFTLPAGATFKGAGRIDTANGAKGGLSYELDAASKDAIAEAAGLLSLSEILGPDALRALPALQIGGLVKLGQSAASSADVTFDGTAGDARIAGDAGFEGGFAAWKTSPVRFALSARGPEISQVLGLLGTDVEALKGLSARPGEGTVAISGLLNEGAKTYADVSAEGLNAVLSGTVTLKGDKTFEHQATGTLKARDAREALALAGLTAPGGLAKSALEGPLEVASAGGKLSIASSGLQVARSKLKGKLEFARGETAGVTRVGGDLTSERVSIAGLLAMLTEADAQSAAPSDDAAAPAWPDGAFNLDRLARLEGTIRLQAATLELADDLSAHEATAAIALAPGKVTMSGLQAKAAGGLITGDVSAEKGAGGVGLTATLKLDADLASLSPRASGRGVFEMNGTGRGLTPASAVSAFAGKGTAKLTDARHPAPSAALVADASDAVFAGKLANDAGSISPALLSGLGNSLAVVPSRTIPFTIAGGDVKVDAYTIEGAQGSARVMTTISLSKLWLDSAWQVAAIPSQAPPPEPGLDWKPAPKGPLPAVSFVYTGRLGDLARLQVDVSVDDLTRELAVRIMERRVEELEALRKRDEDRRKLELEKRKALELEREQAAAAASAAAAAARAQAAQQRQPEMETEEMPPVVPQNGTDVIVPQAGLAGEPVDATAPPPSADGAPPGAGRVVQPAPQPRVSVPRPQPRPQRSSRSTSEEATKAFGGWP